MAFEEIVEVWIASRKHDAGEGHAGAVSIGDVRKTADEDSDMGNEDSDAVG